MFNVGDRVELLLEQYSETGPHHGFWMRKGQQGVVKGIFYNKDMKPNLLSVEFDSGQCCMVYAAALFLVVVEKPKGFALGDRVRLTKDMKPWAPKGFALGDRVRLTKDMKPWAGKHEPGVVVGLTQTFNPVCGIVISVKFENGRILVVPVDSLEPALPAQATQAAAQAPSVVFGEAKAALPAQATQAVPQDPSVVSREAKAAMDTLKHLGYIYKGGMWTPPAVDPVVAARERCWDILMAAIKNYNKLHQKP
jgi:hypothetical protein